MNSSIERYPEAFRASQEILNKCQCSFFPININSIILNWEPEKIIIIPETEYNRFRIETNQQKPYISIKDGRTYYDPNRDLFAIIYNDKQYNNRIRFTLAHEFAHIVLGHLSDSKTEIERGGLPDYLYYSYEGAANTFAGNFLAPPIIISEKLNGKPFLAKSIASMFNISKEAARNYREKDFLYWKTLPHTYAEQCILNRYQQRLHTFLCKVCGYRFMIAGASYCPICGATTTPLRAGDEKNMGRVYPGVETTITGQAKECPICQNEEHLEGASYCMICGKPIINQCTFALCDDVPYGILQCSHTEPLPGNARYCPYCGSETTFLKYGLLQKWNQSTQQSPHELFCSTSYTDETGDMPF